MANLVFLILCSVLCGVIAQDTTIATPPAENSPQPTANEGKPQNAANPSTGEQQGPQTESTVKVPEATPEPAPTEKKVDKEGEIQGRVPLEPPSAQAASANTTDKPKGGSSAVCANTGLFLLGVTMLLKL